VLAKRAARVARSEHGFAGVPRARNAVNQSGKVQLAVVFHGGRRCSRQRAAAAGRSEHPRPSHNFNPLGAPKHRQCRDPW